MDTYLFSIHKRWNDLIFVELIKKTEVRKTAPKPPFKSIVYEPFNGGGCGKVIGEFICDKVDMYRYDKDFLNEKENMYYITCGELEETCLTYEELCNYGNGKDLYGIHITDIKVYDEPKELGEFRKADRKNPTCGYSYCCKAYCGSYDYCTAREVTRPPQSYMRIQDPKEV